MEYYVIIGAKIGMACYYAFFKFWRSHFFKGFHFLHERPSNFSKLEVTVVRATYFCFFDLFFISCYPSLLMIDGVFNWRYALHRENIILFVSDVLDTYIHYLLWSSSVHGYVCVMHVNCGMRG